MRFACWITNATITHSEYVIAYLLIFYSTNSYPNAPQCCVIRTLSVLLETYSSLAGQYVLHVLRHTSVQCCFRQVRHSQWCRTKATDFDVLLTVHLSIFISVFTQLDAQNLFHNKLYFMPLHVSSTCAHHQEVKIALHSLWYHHKHQVG